MTQTTGWHRRLSVAADGKGLIGHAGAVLLRKLADRTGLTLALAGVLPGAGGHGWRDRGAVLVQLAVAIVLGARSLAGAEALQVHHQGLFGPAVSDSTMRRTLAEQALAALARVRARVRRQVWSLLCLRPGGFPWLTIAGKRLHRWVVIDMDATIITAASKKEGACAAWKKSFGFHPLAAWCAHTGECLAMWLRTGSAGANTVADHLRVLTDALAQVPDASTAKILVRVDGAGATHGLHEHLHDLNTRRRTVRFTTGWTITEEDEKAIARLPKTAWETSIKQDGSLQEGYQVAELTALNTREGWIKGMRLIVRRVKPSGRHRRDLTAFEAKTGWKYSIVATNNSKMTRIRGSHQIQWLDALHRHHAVVEDQVRTNKAMGLHNLPSKSWQVNAAQPSPSDRMPRRSSRPQYTSSAANQRASIPAARAPATTDSACCGSVANVISCGTPATSRRSSSSARSAGRYSIRSMATRVVPVTTARWTAIWHSPTPPSAPEYWWPAPTQSAEDFASPVSSTTNTTS